MTRVYVPATESLLRGLRAGQALPGPVPAHAVTVELRAVWPDGNDEEWEYAALMAAAAESLSLRATGTPPRRYVLAADAGRVEAGAGTAVTLPDGLDWDQVAALHADSGDLDGALLADPEAAAEVDLAWYATHEVDTLL